MLANLLILKRHSHSRGRFIRNLRDLSNYVHYDDLPQEFLNACLILKHLGIPLGHDQPCAPQPHGPVGSGNPYLNSRNQEAVATFGDQYILTLVAEVSRRALYAVWFQKWHVHRRLRPEEFAGLIFRKRANPNLDYPINSQILTSQVLTEIETRYGSVLLPQAYPEGSAMHPSYPSGHATIAGACVTVLKAYFDETQNIPNPVQVDESLDGTPDEGKSLKPYSGTLTIGNELNKLASNIALGRNAAGIHYRSDYIQGVLLGEEVAIRLLQDQSKTYNEKYSFRFTRFNGQPKVIEN